MADCPDKTKKKLVVPSSTEIQGIDPIQKLCELEEMIEALSASISQATSLGSTGGTSSTSTGALPGARRVIDTGEDDDDDDDDDDDGQDGDDDAGITNTTIVSVGLGDARYAFKEHSHPTLLSSVQYDGIANATQPLSAENPVLTKADLEENENPLLKKFYNAYEYLQGIRAGVGDIVDVSHLFGGQNIAGVGGNEGLILGEELFLRDTVSLRPYAENGYSVYGILLPRDAREEFTTPSENKANLVTAYLSWQTKIYIDGPLFTEEGYSPLGYAFWVVIDFKLEEFRAHSQTQSYVSLVSRIGEDLPIDTRVLRPLRGEAAVYELNVGAGEWTIGSTGGKVRATPDLITDPVFTAGNRVVINPGEVNEEVKHVNRFFRTADPSLYILEFTSPLLSAHNAGEPIDAESLLELTTSNEFDLHYKVRTVNGETLPFSMNDQIVDLLVPKRYSLVTLPQDSQNNLAEFFHLVAHGGGTGGSDDPITPGNNDPVRLVEELGIGTFSGPTGTVRAHARDLAHYSVDVVVIFNNDTATLGNFGVERGTITPDDFTVINTGQSGLVDFEWMAFAVPGLGFTGFDPTIRSGIEEFSVGGGVGVSIAIGEIVNDKFIQVTPRGDDSLPSLGTWAVGSISPLSFKVHHTGQSESVQFRWTVYDTSTVPNGDLKAVGTGTFPGAGGAYTISHNVNTDYGITAAEYHVVITPLFSGTLSSVGSYGIANKADDTVEVKNTGSDDATTFMWAIFSNA